jgi:hypothetical protein
MAATLVGGLVVTLAGCSGSPGAAPISLGAARQALAEALERPLVENIIDGPDTTTSQIAGSFTGGNEFEHVVAVVFHRPSGTRALTGGASGGVLAGRDRTAVIQVSNVVVLYSRRPGTISHAGAMRRALRAACNGCSGR